MLPYCIRCEEKPHVTRLFFYLEFYYMGNDMSERREKFFGAAKL